MEPSEVTFLRKNTTLCFASEGGRGLAEEIIRVNCDAPMLLRTYLRRYANVSARLLTRLKHQPEGITRNGRVIRAIDTVYHGDILTLKLVETPSFAANPLLRVPVVHETNAFVVYNKPVDMPVHPSAKHREDTLGNCYAAQYPDAGFHAVFRLDRNTSGLCVIAKTAHAAHLLQGNLQKRYFALVGAGFGGTGTICAPIGRVRDSVINRCVRDDGKPAITHYRTLLQTDLCALVELTPETGRTHQIRVHMAYLGFPLLGDDLYCGDCTLLSHHALHCGILQLADPETHAQIRLTAPLREEMAQLLPEDYTPY